MLNTVDSFYFKQTEPNKSCLLALRSFILQQDAQITESLKWGTPCFSYRNRMFCFLALTKMPQLPYLLIVEGHRIEHPVLEAGTRKRMKSLTLDPTTDLPLTQIQEILTTTLNLYQSGQIKTK
ncbi:DUF1801 domain-containing protein [Myroides sp. 1354]|uniref:DUF1801 domain-containing protein n=1 Tax=unclassified Myroides TaxID=2642485 RepID=UPI002574B207|nr:MULTISPECIES: DUF1801 domain-containing protein [unclassified Myroides]MDM1046091.1 DUF1801 domain-containing protein [Myroides sp. R163-1]MDM1057027.1 DUF1801 domain-containing protein [Myroides sp. 1354]MDM1070222.1 DUF1801 domain-containing protein [Myroides sp. 1372]